MTADRQINYSVGNSRKAVSWTASSSLWSELAQRLQTPIRGKESHDAYMRLPKAQQDNLKDVGGFVGGTLRNGRRKAQNVTGRDLITLDLDAIPKGQTDAVLTAVSGLGCASCIYSTRKHEPARPRLRVILPLDRTATPEEYQPIVRRVAEWLGIEQVDPSSFKIEQLMYWPSASADSEFVYDLNEAPFLKADAVLASYHDWKNISEWPQIPGQAVKISNTAKQEDPESKAGIVGAFCRAFSIYRVMDELLPGVYDPTDEADRYTYTGGSTAGGAIVYEGKWMYSHHATDPAGGQLVNAWDLARLHLFGARDDEAAQGITGSKLPSYRAMADYATRIPDVRKLLMDENRARIADDFGTLADPDGDWRQELALNTRGETLGTLVNLKLIFDNDMSLQPIGRDAFQQRNLVFGPLPWDKREGTRDWVDEDDTGAAWYIEAAYGVKDLRRIKMAADMAMAARETDTLISYLERLTWDGSPRVDQLLVRYLKADDTPYTRAVTRKTLAAAVARAMTPGCKFDSVLTLVGAQGIAKSLFAAILGGAWYNDNIQTFIGKEAAEQLRGVWIVEIPEVDRFSAKYESAAVKQFITRQDDIFREAYARRTLPHKRRCIFIATTNEPAFLTDATGNRRWWIVPCHATADSRGEDMSALARDRDQIWAEAVALWRAGESLTLDAELYRQATDAQENAQLEDPWVGMIAEFAARLVPVDWRVRTPEQRLAWWSDDFGRADKADDLQPRQSLCVAEIWAELFRKDRASLDGRSSRRIMNALRRLPGWVEIGVRPTVYGGQKCFSSASGVATNLQPTCNQLQPKQLKQPNNQNN